MVEKENFYRFCGILLDIGAKVLREVFLDKYVGTSTLMGYLASHKQYVTGLHPNILRKEQLDLLYPSGGGAPVIEDFDITLLCLLFRNMDTQTTPYDSVWTDPKTHQTYQADVTRIRLARNLLFGHVNFAFMNNTTYNNEVSNLTTIYHRLVQSLSVGRMSSTELQEMIDRELNGPLQISLDREVKRLKEEIQELHKYVGGFSSGTVQAGELEKRKQWDSKTRDDQQVTAADMWKQIGWSKEVLNKHMHHAGEFFVPNERYRMGKQILHKHGKILLTGKPGQGKTYLAYQLLLKFLANKRNVSPLIISSPDQWMQLADSSTELGIVVDDMCGKYGLLKGELKKWNENAKFITALIDNRKHTVIFTMRTHIYEETSEGLQLESDISDPLFSQDITLKLDRSETDEIKLANKIELTNKYLKRFGLTENEVLQLCRKKEASIGFPQLCKRAQSIEGKSELFDLFSRPLDIMYQELERFCRDKSILYGVLVLVMLSGGKLASESINECTTIIDKKNEVTLIFDSYGVPDVKLADIQLAADKLSKTYLLFNESDESYCFSHDTNEEAVFLSYGKLRPQETLKLCSLRSVCKLCKIKNETQTSNSQPSAQLLDLRPSHHSILIKRFIKALETKCPGDFATIAEANVWASAQFSKSFMDECERIHVLADKDEKSLLVHAANANNCYLAGDLLRGMKQTRAEYKQQAVSYLTKAAKASCVHKDLSLFKQFMNTGNVNVNDILSATVEMGSEEAMLFLLQNGADINYRSVNGESLLHTACIHGKLHMVKLLQSKYSLSVNQCDSNGRSVCHSAAAGGNVAILDFIVQEGADPMCVDIDEMNLLHYACLEGKREMAFHLMDNYSVMLYNVGMTGYTIPHCAAYGGSIDIFNKVCEVMNAPSRKDYNSHSEEKESHHQKQADPKARTKTEETLLRMACLGGKLEMTKYLVEKYPDMINEVKKHNASIAPYAAQSSNVSVLQYLIDQGLDPWCRTSTQQTLLHISCIAGQLEMTKYLVAKYPNMINEVDNCNQTPAHCAAQSSKVSVLQYLFDQGMDSWCRTSEQQTLLHMSCMKGQLEMTQYLVAKYSNMINQVDNCKRTPAHCAAQSSNVSVVQYLIDQGLDPWSRTSTQQTFLHISCIAGQLEMTKYLVAKYPNMINEVDNCKQTPAHYAAQSSNVSVLQYLIHQGLDPWCKTSTQQTLLHLSCIAGRLVMTKYLVAKYPNMINEVDNSKETPAHYAAQSSNVSVLQYLIDQGLDPWCKTSTQQTLLHLSCIAGQLEMTQYVVAKYPNMINEVDNFKQTPAHCAAQSSNVSVVQYLIDQGLDPWSRTSTQQTFLHMSCIAGQLEMTKYLVAKYPNMINEVDNCKQTPAHYAAQSSNVSVLQYLIDQGLDPWCKTSTQQTLLHTSCIKGQLEMTQYLFATYPNMINEVDNCKQTPAHSAAQSSNVSVLQYLIDQGLDPWRKTLTQQTLLHRSCIAGQLEITKYLVAKFPNMINEVDNCKETPAHSAAQSTNVSVLQYLIDQGLDPWCRTSTQQTLLHMSCIAGQLEMTQYLVAKYPNMINEIDNWKQTPAHYAAESSNVSVLQYLIDQGLDPWCRTSEEQTLLHRSCIKGQSEMTQYLVSKYPNMINEVDNCKGTPAHYAAQSSNVSVLQYLIDQGLDPWCRTSTQQTLLHTSCISGQLEMTQYLVAKYPNMINEVDNCKETPAHSAAQSSNVSVLQYLIDQGLDPWCKTSTQQTLLHRSSIAGQLEMTQYLVSNYPNMINEVDNCKETPAHSAAHSANVSVLQYLIDQGLDPWCRTSTQQTLLHKSCIAGQLEMTQYLVAKYPNMINEIDNWKKTPAHYAAQSTNVSVLQYLIDQGLDPWCKTSTQQTLLHRSCIAGQLKMTQYLVSNYPNMINEVDNCKETPAHSAAHSANVSVLQYLIDQGLDPWCRTSTQQTLLHKSCIAGQLEMTKYLVDKYPNMINEVDNCKETPAHSAAQSANVSVLQYLIDQGLDPWCRTSTQQTLLHKSCIAGQLEMTQYLVAKYPNMINEIDNWKETPAHYAAQTTNVSVLQYLIDHGLDPWCKTSTQQTLLHISCIAGQLEMTKYLVAKYPNMINEVDNCKRTPAHYAAQSSNVSVLQYLIDQGLDPWCRTSTQQTLLHNSCVAGQLEMTQYLVAKYPDMIIEVDNCKETPTHYASQSSNISVLHYLIDQGLDPWCKTSTQQTLLHISCIAGQLEMTKYLVDKYPNMINEVDNCKRTPAHYAAQSSNVSVLQYLIDQGLDPWCRTSEEQTLLHMSCVAVQLEMTQYLVAKYPNMINEVDNCKRTPAHYTARSSNVSVLQYLIDQGMNAWCRTSTQQTLLHTSCIKGQLEMTQYLVPKYPNMINEVHNCKETPAHYAAQSSNVSVLQSLIDQGLDPWCKTSTQQTLLHLSCIAGQLEMTQYLVAKYPNMINEVDNCKQTPAHYAAESSNVSVLQYLIDQGLDPWCKTSTQQTLLHLSCIAGQLEMTQYLVAKYPNMINEFDNCKRTPAHYAAQSSNVFVLQCLIDQGLDPWCKTSTQQTFLHNSCIAGQLEMIQYLVAKYPNMINEFDNCKQTAAHYAAQGSNVSALQYLIDQGLDPWCKTSTQQTLLHRSCTKGQLEMTQYLVAKYPNMINEVDNCRRTPAHYAAESSNVSVLQYLIDQGLDPWCKASKQETLLHRSCIAGQLEMTQYLVAKYPNMINEFDNCKQTAAHYAAQGSNVSVLQYLIDQGLDPWCKTSTQQTLLHRSCTEGQLEMTQYLVAKYPNMINEVDNCRRTPAHYAAESSNVSVLQYLIDQGLDPWCKTSKQETLLHRSCIAGQLEMTQYLVTKYPNMINEVDNCKLTPAHYAAESNNVSVLQYLIDQGLDPWCRTATQQTLLHQSCVAGHLEMTQYLVAKYPNMINEVDNCKQTATHCVAQSSNISLLQYLIDQGLDPWCRTSTQETLLHKSCICGQLEMSRYLAETYFNMINEVDHCQRTPAHYAANCGNVSLVQYLIDQGLDPWCKTATQETLLHISCIYGRLEMTQYLVKKYPGMVKEMDNFKRTPARNAAHSSNVSVLLYLMDQGIYP